MRVLLLGGTGRIGSRIKKNLALEEIEVEAPTKKELDLASFSLSDLERYEVDVIVNAAGTTDRAIAERNYLHTEKTNVRAVEKLAIFCRRHSVRLVHLSSGDIYPWGDHAVQENTLTLRHPRKYEESKFDAELAILRNLDKNYWLFRLGYVWSKSDLDALSSLGCQKLLVENRILSPISADLCAKLLARAVGSVLDPCTQHGSFNLSCRGVTTLIGFFQMWDNLGEEKVIYSPYLEPSLMRPAVFPGRGLIVSKFEEEFKVSLPYWETEFYDLERGQKGIDAY